MMHWVISAQLLFFHVFPTEKRIDATILLSTFAMVCLIAYKIFSLAIPFVRLL